jgi:hypothetical protein
MPYFPFTVSITALSREEAAAKLKMVFEWAALPVERDPLSFGLAALDYWAHKKDGGPSGNTAIQAKSQYDCKVYLSGKTLQEAEARFNLVMQWAAYPVDRDWKGLLGCGLRYLLLNFASSHNEKAERAAMGRKG